MNADQTERPAGRLAGAEARARLARLSGWEIAPDDGHIARTFSFKDYYKTMAFVNALAFLAHRADHHPDLEVGYNRCTVRFSTHSVGGLSAKDFEAAAEVDRLLQPQPRP